MSVRARHIHEKGFSLAEMAIVIGAIAMLLGLGLSVGATQLEVMRIKITKERLDAAAAMVGIYADGFQHLPCPADPEAPESDAAFGVGKGTGTDIDTTPDCTATNTIVVGNMVVGMIPFQTLGMPKAIAYDGWDRRFTYAVMENMTNPLGYQNNDGAITILSAAAGTTVTSEAIFLVISHGPNGHGAWPGLGGSRLDMGSSDTSELENSHVNGGGAYDAEFVDGYITQTFDDMIVYRTKWQLCRYYSCWNLL